MTTKRERMIERIEAHAVNLTALFPKSRLSGVKLCKYLRRLENKAHGQAEDYCNGMISGLECDLEHGKILAFVNYTLGNEGNEIPILINSDPRGYALKIKDRAVLAMQMQIHRDMGGYGILAPDLTDD